MTTPQQTAPQPNKLCIIIVPDGDGDRLIAALAKIDLGATRVGSSGGFLRRGSATVFSAIHESRVSELTALLYREFPEVIEPMALASLPFADELEMPSAATVDVRVGGAVLFVVPLERVERV
ncbi:MAG: hypothetical protein C4558_03220 [Dehalococcoidia bacterium]|nr:MAG: hypothetical protein C4558_03220 [Dehalococcoidia bacterium]